MKELSGMDIVYIIIVAATHRIYLLKIITLYSQLLIYANYTSINTDSLQKKGNPGQNANYHLSIIHSLCILTWLGCDSGWQELRERDRWEGRWPWRKKTEEKRCAWPGFKELTLQRVTAGLLRAKLGQEGQTPNQYPKGGPTPLRMPACQSHLFYRAIPGPLCPTPESVKFSLLLPSNVSCATVSLMIRSPSPGKTARLTSKHMHLASTQHTLAEWMTPCAVKQSEIPNSEVTIVWKQECQGSKKKCEKVKAMWRDYLCICVLKCLYIELLHSSANSTLGYVPKIAGLGIKTGTCIPMFRTANYQ